MQISRSRTGNSTGSSRGSPEELGRGTSRIKSGLETPLLFMQVVVFTLKSTKEL